MRDGLLSMTVRFRDDGARKYVDCDGGPMGNQCESVRTCPTAPGDVRVAQRGNTLTLTSPSGSATSTFVLPASASGASVVDCCAEDCCQAP